MMRSKCSTALLALVALLALGALASSASAAESPEFSKANAKVEGATGTVLFINNSGTRAQFANSTLSGKISSKSTIGSVALSFKGSGGAEGVCTNTESNTGLSLTGLNAKLGWINKAKNEVGLMFAPPKQPMTSCRWDDEKIELVGEFIGKITPVGTPTQKFTVALTSNVSQQLPQYFEGEKESLLGEVFPLSYGYCESTELGKKVFEECTHNLNTAIQTSITLDTNEMVEIKG